VRAPDHGALTEIRRALDLHGPDGPVREGVEQLGRAPRHPTPRGPRQVDGAPLEDLLRGQGAERPGARQHVASSQRPHPVLPFRDVEEHMAGEAGHLVKHAPEQASVAGEGLEREALERMKALPLMVAEGLNRRQRARHVSRHRTRVGLLARTDEGDMPRRDLAGKRVNRLRVERVLAAQHGQRPAQTRGRRRPSFRSRRDTDGLQRAHRGQRRTGELVIHLLEREYGEVGHDAIVPGKATATHGPAVGYPPVAVFAWFDKLPFWSIALSYVVLWALVGVLVRGFLRRSLLAVAAARATEWSEVLAQSLPRPAGIAVFLVAIATGLHALPLEEMHLSAAHKIVAVALALLGIAALMRVALKAIDAFGRSNPALASSAGIGKAITWVIGAGIAAVLLSEALGISLAPALTALGVGSLAVALALQDTLSNFFSGVTILMGKPVRPGDFIRVDPTYEGYVESIGWRTTQLRTLANNMVVIPNATLSKAIITNYSLPSANVSSSVRIDVALDADLDCVEDALADEARRAVDIPAIAETPAPSVALAPGFVDGVVAFSVYFQVRSFGDQTAVQHALRKRIAARFKKDGIAFASVRTAVLKQGS
jgi:small-conductance mechanosensitive channel